MNDQYLDAFIRESEEAITELNNSLLDLESDPEDTEAMESIFRTAHTLKGNFGAMGFDDASSLAHAIEDLLDEMRDGNMPVTPDVMDLIFAGVDKIEAIVSEIEEHGESGTDVDEIVDDLRTVLEEGVDAAEGAADDADGPDEAPDDTTDTDSSGDGDVAVETNVSPDTADDSIIAAEIDIGDSDMLGVDAMLAIEAVEDYFDVLDAAPQREAVEDGEFSDTFTLYLDAEDTGTVDNTLSGIGKIESAETADVTDALSEKSGSTSDETEHKVDEIKSVRVDVDQLDDLHGLVEQLVTSRIKLRRAVEQDDLDGAGENLNELDKITANLQNTVMDMRLIPLKKVVGKFPRLVRDLSRDLGKEVDFEIEGEDIELDRTILTEISDPLMHILRNSVDHGIEPPEVREEKGKPRTGTVELRASRERDHVIIQVEDDGAGLDVEAIRDKAIEKGVRSPEELEAMDDSSIYDLVFHPGFSTADQVTDTSGRGVGMDVVHDTVTQLDGSVNVESTPGEGTTVSLRLPVTMAIVKVLFVEVGDEEYGIPLKNVDEITRADDRKQVNGKDVIKHNDEIYPIIQLGETFDAPGETANGDGMLVRVRESERQVALHCDSVNSQEEVVVKPLEGILSGTPGLSGTAVLGDGNIVHILDVVTL
ncbi:MULTISPECIES: chemotaxis protein CheA [Halomicrobium]|uniref:Chemotaxis protein CheA n=2 Tax=Halomicrobium mukohataei TaxID=57705 RepID=C7NX21_HALMD|nr:MULTISPECIES: chemotaxis protein CheA [Halomicrobium]ACV46386.1 CheA signal transduction histidine kinase [Halomicrobium mukohataei DSM 12286]QCD64939.1 chemotaxis protein CheA [Halomicrobium mukohataei]QFR19745.1 chemotaxis protein CheA [Halomicrobium sp. ZPS1]